MSLTSNNILKKPIRVGTRIQALSVKPVEIREENDKLVGKVVFINKDSAEVRYPCTPAVLARVRPSATSPERWNLQVNKMFWFIADENGTVFGADICPENAFSRGGEPEDLKGVTEMIISFDNNGNITVTQLPARVATNTIVGILNALDAKDTIAPGDSLNGHGEVISVAGNTIHVRPKFNTNKK
jgi:hypothetical protein